MHSLWFVQWDFTRRDHPGNPGGVSGSGPVSQPYEDPTGIEEDHAIPSPPRPWVVQRWNILSLGAVHSTSS